MKRTVLAILVLFALTSTASAGRTQKDLVHRWLGAWVITTTEAYSDCGGMFTNNRVNGRFVSSKGAHPFEPGELAKVKKIDLKKSRMDVHLIMFEPILVDYPDGPFTLYRELECLVEMEVVVPRNAVKKKDVAAIDRTIEQVARRFASQAEAKRSGGWNQRVRDPYPADYERTLVEHAAWKVAMHNNAVQARLDRAMKETGRLADRVGTDADYLAGFSTGVEVARSIDWDMGCKKLMALKINPRSKNSSTAYVTVGNDESRYAQGERDGRMLVHGLELINRLPHCFLPEPEPFEYSEE
jgi:hypothetical protein